MGKKSSTRIPSKESSPRLRSFLWGLIAILLAAGLVSYDRLSPLTNHLGYSGFLVSWLVLYLWGCTAFLLPLYAAWQAYLCWQRRPVSWKYHFLFFVFLLSCSLFLTLVAHSSPKAGQAFGRLVYVNCYPDANDPFHIRYYLGGVPMDHLYLGKWIQIKSLLGPFGSLCLSLLGMSVTGAFLFPLPWGRWVQLGWEAIRGLNIQWRTKIPALVPATETLAPKEEEPWAPPPPKKQSKVPQIHLPSAALEEKTVSLPPPESLSGYQLPNAPLLTKAKVEDQSFLKDGLKKQAQILEQTLASFGLEATVGNIHAGPTIASFEVQPAFGVKVQKITALESDLALNLQAKSIRIIAPIPGKAAVGIEIPSPTPQEVGFRELLENYRGKAQIPLLLGKKVNGEDIFADLTKMPHLIIAGATGSGKSVCINTMVMSILMMSRPDEVKLVMVDPKKVELTGYSRLPHMLAPVITEPGGALAALQWLVKEMERRYELFRKLGIRNILGFNGRTRVQEEEMIDGEVPNHLPYIVVIIDELADLMMVSSSDMETPIARLAQMARAVGIHLILATQRPSREVLTGLIKANFPTRIAFKVSSRVNSQIILDENGAEALLGNGDMLFIPPGTSSLVRVQGAYIRDEDIHRVIDWICKQAPTQYLIPNFDHYKPLLEEGSDGEEVESQDRLFDEAKRLVCDTGTASTTFLQRKLKIGYARAASLMDQLEAAGIVGPAEGAKPRKIFYPSGENDT